MLHDIPGIIRKPLQDNDLQWSEAVVESGLKTFLNPKNSSYKIFQLVYGKAGKPLFLQFYDDWNGLVGKNSRALKSIVPRSVMNVNS